jgi:xylulokinase
VPEPDEYVAIGAARQAAWAHAANTTGTANTASTEPPHWPLAGMQRFEADPTPRLREQYAAVRDVEAG